MKILKKHNTVNGTALFVNAIYFLLFEILFLFLFSNKLILKLIIYLISIIKIKI